MQYCAKRYSDEIEKMQNNSETDQNALSIDKNDSAESIRNKISMIKGMCL